MPRLPAAAGSRPVERHAVARWAANARRYPRRRRMALLATSAADAVDGLGGWMFDAALAGWEVTVVVTERGDERALAVLGAVSLDLDAIADPVFRATAFDVFALSTDLFDRDQRVRAAYSAMDRDRRADVIWWGPDAPTDAPTAHHREASRAARAFKARALSSDRARAVGIPEQYWSAEPVAGLGVLARIS